MDEYRRVLGDKIANVRGVRHTQTYFVLEEVKSTHAVRIRPIESGRSATPGKATPPFEGQSAGLIGAGQCLRDPRSEANRNG